MPEAPIDAIIVGGGMFGCSLARQLRQHLDRVVLLERESDLLQRASRRNQARVHAGYHYPRSLLTALRSRVNFPRFVHDFRDCLDESTQLSRVGVQQFEAFCERIGSPLEPAPERISRLFDPRLIRRVYAVEEVAFDAVKLKQRLRDELDRLGVDIHLSCEVQAILRDGDGLSVVATRHGLGQRLRGRYVFNCTYASLNEVLASSGLPTIPLKYELAEMALVELGSELKGLGITIVDGPYFSLMPYPSLGCHTLSHVRYTPHRAWSEGKPSQAEAVPASHFPQMIHDVARYLPAIAHARYRDSLWEVKAVLPSSEESDSRPILFRVDHGLPNLVCVLGGKIDNVYDVLEEIDQRVRGGWLR